MNLTDLKAALNAHPYQGAFTETNVESVECDGTDLHVVFDESQTESDLKDANEAIAELEKEVDELKGTCETAETERDAANALLDEFKDPESGVTVAQFKKQAEDARALAAAYRSAAEKAWAELSALRKRKGVEPALFANGRALIELVRELANRKEFATSSLREPAQKVSARITGYVPWSMP